MQTKGKGSKVLVAICKDRSRLLTFPRGDSPPLKAVYVTSPVREKCFMAVFVLVQGVSHRYCTVVQRGNGYGYSLVAKTDVRGTPPQHRDASHPALYLPGLQAEVSRAN